MTRPSILLTAAVATDVVFGDIDGNLLALTENVERGVDSGARLIVLPELATSGYAMKDKQEARRLALRADDPELLRIGNALPHEAIAVFGFCERDGDKLYNSALVIEHGTVLACYRKSHLWDKEKMIFTPGNHAGMIVDSPLGRLAVAICYDNEFPEVPRRLALAQADVLALPVAWPLVPRPVGEHPPETIQAMAAARTSRLPTIIADRRGTERGIEWTNGTTIIDADGWIQAEVDEETDFVTAALNIGDPDRKSIGPFNDVFTDRRPDLYGPQ